MNNYELMIGEMDGVLDRLNDLTLEEGERFLADFQKRLEYVRLVVQAKRTKASFREGPKLVSPQAEAGATRHGSSGSEVYGETTITDNDLKYGILRFSSVSDVSRELVPNSKLWIEIGGDRYQASIPKSVVGRINGVSALYKEHSELTEQRDIRVKYNLSSRVMTIE